MRKYMIAGAAALAGLGVVVLPAQAQRDPAYAAARAAGTVGEQADGYLGIVGNATPALRRMVDDINIKRRAVYARKAQENNATLEAYALTAGCQAIMRTVAGEKYQAPDGSWKTRTSAPPERDPRCP
ncbi:MAG: YdbL family protein [Pseudomonadota bacterium]